MSSRPVVTIISAPCASMVFLWLSTHFVCKTHLHFWEVSSMPDRDTIRLVLDRAVGWVANALMTGCDNNYWIIHFYQFFMDFRTFRPQDPFIPLTSSHFLICLRIERISNLCIWRAQPGQLIWVSNSAAWDKSAGFRPYLTKRWMGSSRIKPCCYIALSRRRIFFWFPSQNSFKIQ